MRVNSLGLLVSSSLWIYLRLWQEPTCGAHLLLHAHKPTLQAVLLGVMGLVCEAGTKWPEFLHFLAVGW
jgi:hypothetical protein